MTKAQALATLSAMESSGLAGSVVLTFPSPGVEQWSIALDPKVVYTGTQLVSIGNYCANNGLALTGTFSAFGIV